MKRGDILINRWAGHIDCRYFIYLGTQGDWIVGLEFIEGRPRKQNIIGVIWIGHYQILI